MPPIFDRILTLNLVANTAIFYIAARLYLLPLLPRLRPQQILLPILLLHSMRHLGMMFLTRGATYPGLAAQFAYPAAFGDLLTAVAVCLSGAELFGAADDLIQSLEQPSLLVNQKLRVTNNVYEQDVCDLELDLFLNLSGHF